MMRCEMNKPKPEKEYIIVGDSTKYKQYKGTLICLAGHDKKRAVEILRQMLENPTENDIKMMKDHTNFRVKEVISDNQWWNDPFLAN